MPVDKRNHLKSVLSTYQFIFILCYTAQIILDYIPVRAAIPQLILNAINVLQLGAGAVFLVMECRVNWKKYLNASGILRAFFIVVAIISSLRMRQYGVTDNIKSISWICVELFLLFSVDASVSPETLEKRFRVFTEAVILISTVGIAISLGQFLLHYHTVYYIEGWPACHQGFVGSRLFGIFEDPNFMAIFCIAVIIFSIIHILWWSRKLFARLFHIAVIFLHASYLVLSGSRTAEICLATAAAFIVAMMGMKKVFCRKRAVTRTVLSAIMAAAAVALIFVGITGIRAGYSWLYKRNIGQTVSITAQSPAHAVNTPQKHAEDDRDIFKRADVEHFTDSNGRMDIWKDYVQVFKQVPILGASPRNARFYAADQMGDMFIVRSGYNVHNTYLALFVCTGLIGGCAAVAWLALIAFKVLRFLVMQKPCGKEYYMITLLTGFMVAAAIAAFPLLCFFFKETTGDLSFWITLGFMLAFIQQIEDGTGQNLQEKR